VLAFKPYYKQATKQSVSGWSEQMYEDFALDLWKQEESKDYQFTKFSCILKQIQSMIGRLMMFQRI
jgi:hypothetical protein